MFIKSFKIKLTINLTWGIIILGKIVEIYIEFFYKNKIYNRKIL